MFQLKLNNVHGRLLKQDSSYDNIRNFIFKSLKRNKDFVGVKIFLVKIDKGILKEVMDTYFINNNGELEDNYFNELL